MRVWDLHPPMMKKCLHTELSSLEGTRGQFNGRSLAIKLGIDVHQEFYVVVVQEGGSNPKPPQEAFLARAARLKAKSGGAPIDAVYEACGFTLNWGLTLNWGQSLLLTLRQEI